MDDQLTDLTHRLERLEHTLTALIDSLEFIGIVARSRSIDNSSSFLPHPSAPGS